MREHREIDARKEAEERTDIFLCRGVEGGNGSALRGEASCGRTGEGVVDGIKPAHTAQFIRKEAGDGQHDIDRPNPFGSRAELGVELGDDRSCGLGCKDACGSTDKRGQDGYREEDNTQTTDPLGDGTPEEQATWKPFRIVDDGSSRRRKTRYGLKEGVRHRMEIAAYQERHHAKDREEHPDGRHHEIGIASAQRIRSLEAQQAESYTSGYKHDDTPRDGHNVATAIVEGHAQTTGHKQRLDEQQRSEDFGNKFGIEHIALFVTMLIVCTLLSLYLLPAHLLPALLSKR